MDLKQELLLGVKANINAPGLFNHLLDRVAKQALDEAVNKTSTPLDDVLLAALYPTLAVELKKAVASEWEKLFPAATGEVLGEPV